jgi:hypothetical protein
MNYKSASRLLWLLVLLLFIGTQMPYLWRVSIANSLNTPVVLTSWTHFVLFAVITVVAAMRPLAWQWRRVLFMAFGLALITEGFQFFSIDRHPRMTDVTIDMAGALIGLVFVKLFTKRLKM